MTTFAEWRDKLPDRIAEALRRGFAEHPGWYGKDSIDSFGDLVRLRRCDVAKLRGIGLLSIAQLSRALHAQGLQLKPCICRFCIATEGVE